MSEAVVFQIGVVIFLAVFIAVFLYGMSTFRDWEDLDEGMPVDDGLRDGAAQPVASPTA